MRNLLARSWLARLVLAWYALTLGVAMASPLVQPQTMAQVCAANGAVMLVALDADGDPVAHGPLTLDCALCLATALPTTAPPPLAARVALAHAPALAPVATAPRAARVGAPLPARGPPALASALTVPIA